MDDKSELADLVEGLREDSKNKGDEDEERQQIESRSASFDERRQKLSKDDNYSKGELCLGMLHIICFVF
jgi:hypothetical protein